MLFSRFRPLVNLIGHAAITEMIKLQFTTITDRIRNKIRNGTKETKAKFSRNTDTPLCELCYEETEDVKHFLLICPTLNDKRRTPIYAQMLPKQHPGRSL